MNNLPKVTDMYPKESCRKYEAREECTESVSQFKTMEGATEVLPEEGEGDIQQGGQPQNRVVVDDIEWEKAVQQNGWALYHVPKELKTEQLCKLAVQQDGRALQLVPNELKTEQLCTLAVQQNGWALEYVPDNLKTEELCLTALRQDIGNCQFVPPRVSKNILGIKNSYPYTGDITQDLEDLGVSIRTAYQARALSETPAQMYNPASDVVNLFPVVLSAAVNGMIRNTEPKMVREFAQTFLGGLLSEGFESFNPDTYAMKLIGTFNSVKQEAPESAAVLFEEIAFGMFLTYAIASKHGLRGVPAIPLGHGVFQYHAMMSVWKDLSKETMYRVAQELADKDLWGFREMVNNHSKQ